MEERPRQSQGQKGPNGQHVSGWLAGGDVRKTTQSASSPGRRWEEFGERRRAEARSPEWDAGQDGSFVKPRHDKPALSESFLPWSRTQLSEAGKGPAVVSRGQSMRRRLLLVGEGGARMLGRAVRTKGPGRNQTRAALAADR